MLNICKTYFDKHKITISTNVIVTKTKTKCIIFGSKEVPAPIRLYEKDLPWDHSKVLPWVESWPHLGHLLHSDQSLSHDLLQRRGQFIGKIHSFRQEFGNIDPIVYMKLVSIYLLSFYGSNLWDLYEVSCDKLDKSWNIMVRYFFDIPRTTLKYLLEHISGTSRL